ATEAEAARRHAEAEHRTWQARVDALTLALDSGTGSSLPPAAVGVLSDLIDVDSGWEEAVAAAVGEALAAPVVEDAAPGRSVPAALDVGDVTGAVVTGGLLGHHGAVASAPGAEPVRPHVRGRMPAVDRALDVLLAGHVLVDGGWEAALGAALAHPELTVVTRAGDRFAAGTWRLGASRAGVTAAALDDARQRADEAAGAVAATTAAAAEAAGQLAAATAAHQDAARRLDENDGSLSAAADALAGLEAERRDVAVEGDAVRPHLDELIGRISRETARVSELEALLPGLEAEEA